MKNTKIFLILTTLVIFGFILWASIASALELDEEGVEQLKEDIAKIEEGDPELARAMREELKEAVIRGELELPESDDATGREIDPRMVGEFNRPNVQTAEGKERALQRLSQEKEAIKREFKNELGREMTADEEKQIFDRKDDGKYHGSNHDYAREIAGREQERAAREYYGRDTSTEIDYDREAMEREREANSREREYGREIPERNYERDSSRETDYDREAREREREANMMERY